MKHLSARLSWHDSGWNGKVCEEPLDNNYCVIHEHIREGKDDEFEDEHSNEHIDSIDNLNDYPPCAGGAGAFSPRPHYILHEDPLEFRGLEPAREKIKPYSFCTTPYEEMFSEEENKTWKSDSEEQKKSLENFFDDLVEEVSLVFFYLKDAHPLSEDGERVLAGVSRISDIDDMVYFRNSEFPVWPRQITHNYPEEGVRLPYQEYVREGHDTDKIVCEIPGEATDSFSYVANHVPDDDAIGVLERLLDSLKTVRREGKIDGDWDEKIEFVEGLLDETWRKRGMHPGTGSVLNYLTETETNKLGHLFENRVQPRLVDDGENPLEYLERVLEGEEEPEEILDRFDLEMAKMMWEDNTEEKRELLRTLTAFDLTREQVEDIMWSVSRNQSSFTVDDLRENIYLLAEPVGYKSAKDIPFSVIDRGAKPEMERIKEVGEKPDFPGFLEFHQKNDKGRVRARLASLLSETAQNGDTVLSAEEAIEAANSRMSKKRHLDVQPDDIVADGEFYSESLRVHEDISPTSISLPRYEDMEQDIAESLSELMERDVDTEELDWRGVLDDTLDEGDAESLQESVEKEARKEKTEALETMYESGFSVLRGRAGTGKTTVVKTLLEGLDRVEGNRGRLLLAPTGKARVRLEEVSESQAQTIHQFLMKNDWLDPGDDFRLKEEGGDQGGANTVIVDEASMIPSDLMATLLRALDLNLVRRLVFIGDPNQLPPIGPGRPFFDIINELEDNHPSHVCELQQRVRQSHGDARELADVFAGENEELNDEILSKIAKGETEEGLEVKYWQDSEELRGLVDETLKDIFRDYSPDDEIQGFEASVGYGGGGSGRSGDADSWQILSPTRIRDYGTHAVNRQIQERYRGHLIQERGGYGDEQIVEGDKVIQTNNQRRDDVNGEMKYVANGEIGYVSDTPSPEDYSKYESPDYAARVDFTTQDELLEYSASDINDEDLELAYGLTVHKAQGSEFDTVILILPEKAATLSRELLYTALTRYKEKMVLLIQGDTSTLEKLRKTENSDIRKRSTNIFEPQVRSETIVSESTGAELYYPESLIHKTRNDELVRSKSEVIIANTLDKLGISYEYEEKLESREDSDDFRIPDFTIDYKGERYYWEHLGMLQDEEYKQKWESKEQWYDENGYSDRLITSRDDERGGIDAGWIEEKARREVKGL